jgi:diguanylate cyclase (GGDEF)-like protein
MPNERTLKMAHVLLMSGDPQVALVRGAQLSLAGWQVISAAESIDALAAVRSRHVDLAVLHLPAADLAAMDLPAVLREVSPAPYLPVIVLAQSPAERDRCRYLDCGADDILCMGASGEEMAARIRALLRVKELHDQLASSRLALEESLRRERKLMVKLRQENTELQVIAATDPLTHVQNQRNFHDILAHEFRGARRYNQPLSLLALDVDHFKVVNDTYGHPCGDYVLKEFAVILKQSVRESDVVARTGGEEFSVLLPKAGRAQAAQFAERIRRQVARREFAVYGQAIHITTSIGSATYPADAEVTEPGMLAYLADQALLHAKENGRDRVAAVHQFDAAARVRLRRQYLAARNPNEEEPTCRTAVEVEAEDRG